MKALVQDSELRGTLLVIKKRYIGSGIPDFILRPEAKIRIQIIGYYDAQKYQQSIVFIIVPSQNFMIAKPIDQNALKNVKIQTIGWAQEHSRHLVMRC